MAETRAATAAERRKLQLLGLPETVPTPGIGSRRAGLADEEEEDAWGLWRGLLIGLMASVCGFWAVLGLLVWWWLR